MFASGNSVQSVPVVCGIFKLAIGYAKQGIMFITWRVSHALFVPDNCRREKSLHFKIRGCTARFIISSYWRPVSSVQVVMVGRLSVTIAMAIP
jgi:hypothetical protein